MSLRCKNPRDTPTVNLTSTNIHSKCYDFYSHVLVSQVFQVEYHSPTSKGFEGNYCVPLNRNCTVTSFIVKIEEKTEQEFTLVETLTGTVQEQSHAKQTYADAIVEGKSSSFLLEKNEFLFQLLLMIRPVHSSIRANRITLQFEYLQHIQWEHIPNTEYFLQSEMNHFSKEIFAKLNLDRNFFVDTEELLFRSEQIVSSSTVVEDVKIQFELCTCVSAVGVTPFVKQSNFIKLSDTVYELQTTASVICQDIHFYWLPSALAQNKVWIMEDKNPVYQSMRYCVALPIKAPQLTHSIAPSSLLNSELVFLIDCSGSMSGDRIVTCYKTLKLFLHSIPKGTLFNIYKFGSTFTSLYSKSKRLDQNTLTEAQRYIEKMDADLGGTELLTPLQHIISEESQQGYFRQLFLLTDGYIHDSDQVVKFVNTHCNRVKIYSFGIQGCDESLVAHLASATNGNAELITQLELMPQQVMKQLTRALRPALLNGTITWPSTIQCISAEKLEEIQDGIHCFFTFSKLPPIFFGTTIVVYVFMNQLPQETVSITFSSLDQKGEQSQEQILQLDPSTCTQSNTLHKLALSYLIKDLQDNHSAEVLGWSHEVVAETNIVDFSIRYQIASKYTSFVAVSDRYATTKEAMEVTRKEEYAGGDKCKKSFGGGFNPLLLLLLPVILINRKVSQLKEYYEYKKEIKALKKANELETLLTSVSIDGTWKWSDVKSIVSAYLSSEQLKQISKECKQHKELSCTVSVIVVLFLIFGAQQTMWELVMHKAMEQVKLFGKIDNFENCLQNWLQQWNKKQ